LKTTEHKRKQQGHLEYASCDDFQPEQIEQVDQMLMHHSTPLGLDGKFAGSGTFIRCHKLHGILTARHVIERFDFTIDSRQVLSISVMDGRPHEYSLDMCTLQCVKVGRPKRSNPRAGPDLAVIVLPDVVAKNISYRKNFHDLSVHRRERLKEAKRPAGLWCAFGFPQEQVDVQVSDPKSTMIHCVGLLLLTTVTRRRGVRGFDYLHLAVGCEKLRGKVPPPRKYKGMSGSGVWQIPIVADAKGHPRIQIEKALLAGVVFFETRQAGQSKELRCHGPKSLYVKVRNALIRRAKPRH
jgi:hypothetical protein